MSAADTVSSDEYSSVAALLKRCAQEKDLEAGKAAHAQIVKENNSNVSRYIGNLLVNMYGKCGRWEEAKRVFYNIDNKSDATSWTILIRAYTQNGQYERALQLYFEMHLEGIKPDAFTLSTLIVACGNLHTCKMLHSHAHEAGTLDECNLFVGNCLIGLYARCGKIDGALKVFNGMREKDLFAWDAIITAHTRFGHCKQALVIFCTMLLEGLQPGGSSLMRALGTCASLRDISSGKRIHGYAVEAGFMSDVKVANCVVNMYGKCGRIEDAESVLRNMPVRNVVSWNVIITAYTQKGQSRNAFAAFRRMDVQPNYVTFVTLLTACIAIGDTTEGRKIHSSLEVLGFQKHVVVGNCLINMYGKGGLLRYAKAAFFEIEEKDQISWNSLIAAYAQHGNGKEALFLYRMMTLEGIKQDLNTLTSALDACTMEEDLKLGEHIHCRINELKMLKGGDDIVGTALISFYGRCGTLDKATDIFNDMHSLDIVTWNAMLTVYAQRGLTNEALELFWKLGLEGIGPDNTTFIIIFYTCSHAGLFDHGWDYFISLSSDYGLKPTAEHYRCIVDLLGRAGHVSKAEQVIQSMPDEGNRLGWMMLLSACKLQNNVDTGVRAAEKIMQLDDRKGCSSAYIVLSNMFSQLEPSRSRL